MRKATIGLLGVLCLWGATSWKSQPQWTVVAEHHVVGGTTPFTRTPIFTPRSTGLFRLSAYCSASGGPVGQSGWAFLLGWKDSSGGTGSANVGCVAGTVSPYQSTMTILSPQAGLPFLLSANSSGEMLSTYDVAFTIEQLQ
jgi:hypothetical protein